MTKKRLYITEKASQLGPLKEALKKLGLLEESYVLQLQGHIFRALEPKEYEDGIKNWYEWYVNDKLPYVPKKWLYTLNEQGGAKYKKFFKDIKNAAKEVEEIYLATDPDAEGVRLGLEVLEHIPGSLKKFKGMLNMNDTSVNALVKEIQNPSIVNWKELSNAGAGRAKGDWIYGHNLTVAASVAFSSLIGETANVGPVKSVIMRLVVDRDEQFEKFKEIPFWQLKGIGNKDNIDFGINFKYKNDEGKYIDKIDNKNIIQEYYDVISKNPEAKVIETKKQKKKQKPPLPLTLTAAQIELGKRYGFSMKKSMDIIQKLYDYDANGGFITYPRTSVDKYTEEEFKQFPNILMKLKNKYKNIIDKIDTKNLLKRKEVIQDGKKLFEKYGASHTALRPTGRNDLDKLTSDELKVYNVVLEYFLYQLFPDYEYDYFSGKAQTSHDKVIIDFNDKQTINKGYKIVDEILNKKNIEEKFTLPAIKKGDIINIKDLKIHQGKTKPKPRFTEQELLSVLENIEKYFDDPKIKKQLKDKGIGTSATRTPLIQQLYKDKFFVKEKKGKKEYIKSTEKTRKLIKILPEIITSPILRAKMEELIFEAKLGKVTEQDIVEYFIEKTKELIQEIKQIQKQKNLQISNKKGKNMKTGLKCPLCGGEIIEKDKLFVCENQEWNKDTKQNEGCPFSIWKKSKVFDKEITKDMLEKLLEGKEITDSKGNKMVLDTDEKYFTKVIFNKTNGNNNTKELDLVCPLCKKGKLIVSDKVVKCSEAKWNKDTKQNEGCPFVIFREQKLLKKKLSEKDIKTLIEKGELETKNAKLILDLNNKYFTKVEFKK